MSNDFVNWEDVKDIVYGEDPYYVSDDNNYDDQHGFLSNDDSPENIEALAWNKNTPIVENGNYLGLGLVNDDFCLKCKHFDKPECDEEYVYPMIDGQELCLCKYCNADIAKRIFDQLILENFN